LLKSSGKIQAQTPQEVKTTPSRNALDLVKGLKRSGRALHAPKLPRSAGIPDSLTTCTAARRVAFARFASLRSVDDSGRGLRPRTTWKDTSKNPTQEVKTTPSRNDLDLVKGLKRSGRALHAPKLPRSAGARRYKPHPLAKSKK